MIIKRVVGSLRTRWKPSIRPSITALLVTYSVSTSLFAQEFLSSVVLQPSVKIHTEDARATLVALQNRNLTLDEALLIARMPGNQGVIRKLQEFRIASTTESFANALYENAHGTRVTGIPELAIGFDRVKPKSQELLSLLGEIEANPKTFQRAIEDRIRLFTPEHADIHLEGYVVAAGDGGGYAFGGTDFFLNVGIAEDLLVAKSTTIHELYHSVQGAYAADRAIKIDNTQGPVQIACANQERLFASLYEEGTARFVEDTALLSQSKSEAAFEILTDFNDGARHVHNGITLLDMSINALGESTSLSFEDVYEVGFLGHGVLYGVGYVMARDIADSGGRQAIVDLLKEPSYMFILRYAELAKYGIDDVYPKLGSNTVAAARRLAAGCK
jgi:Putative zinc dependent peptidase (DUF5700)